MPRGRPLRGIFIEGGFASWPAVSVAPYPGNICGGGGRLFGSVPVAWPGRAGGGPGSGSGAKAGCGILGGIARGDSGVPTPATPAGGATLSGVRLGMCSTGRGGPWVTRATTGREAK